VAADDRPVLAPGQDRLDEAELAEAPLKGVELGFVDPSGVRRVGPEVVERDVLDGEAGGGRHRPDRPCIVAPTE
jgi:hypothetical protein